MNDFIISCLESRVETGGNLYGKFFIGPFRLGQGTTIATALRRSLLSELSGLAIVAVEVKGAEHEYSALPGVRESVLDIILNLKQVTLTGVLKSERPCIGFLQFSGPGEAKASHIKFPAGIAPVHGNHHIATLSYDATLCLKLFIIQGKDSLIHNPSTIQNLEKLGFISSVSKANRAFPFHERIDNSEISVFEKVGEMLPKKVESHLPNENDILETLRPSPSSLVQGTAGGGLRTPEKERATKVSKNLLQTELLANSLDNIEKKKKLEIKPSKFSFSSFKNKKFFTISQRQKSFYKNAILNILSKNSNEGSVSKKNFSSVFPDKTNLLPNVGLFGLPLSSDGQFSFLNLEEKRGKKGIFQKGKRSLSEKLTIFLKKKMRTDFSSSSPFDFSIVPYKGGKFSIPKTVSPAAKVSKHSGVHLREAAISAGNSKNLENYSILSNSISFPPERDEREISIPATNVFEFPPSIASEIIGKAERCTGLRKNRCVLPVDALFTPIHKANFSVETDTSLTEANDHVVFEIWTNGTLHPRQALFESAGTLIELFSNFRQIDPWFYMKKNLFFMFDQKQYKYNASHLPKFGNRLRYNQYLLEINQKTKKEGDEKKEKNWMKKQAKSQSPISETKISKSAIDSIFKKFSQEQEFSIDKKITKLPFASGIPFQIYNKSNGSPFDIDLFTDQSVFSKRMVLNEKSFQVSETKTDFITLQRDLGNLDIANLNLSLSVFVALKNFGINNLQDLLKYSSTQYISLSILNLKDLKLLENSLKEIGLKLVS
jgi:DNA-directed RNA polymerase alpha subunit